MVIEQIAPDKLEEISRKFNALMAKAKSTDSPSEAENCVALAQRMLWNSNLEESQLLSSVEIAKRAKREFIKDGIAVGPDKYALDYKFNSREWKSELLGVLTKSFFCRIHQGYAEIVTLVGEPKNIQIVKDLYVYLEKQIRASRRVAFNLAKEQGRIQRADGGYSRNLSQFAVHSFKDSFAKGAVSAIALRLEAQQRENIAETDKVMNARAALQPGANLNDVTHSFGNQLVVQIHTELEEAFYEFFPELHPAQVKLREYQRQIEYNERMAQLNKEREEREARIAAGLEPAPEPPKPQKEYKRRGRKPKYRQTFNSTAYYYGKVAGNTIQINQSLGSNQGKLNK